MDEQCKGADRESLSRPKIVSNSYAAARIEGEAFITDHIFSYILSGSHQVWMGDRKFNFKAGDLRLFKRNQLCRYVKSSGDAGFKSVAVHIDRQTLTEMSSAYQLHAEDTYNGEGSILLGTSPLLRSYVDSLIPYLQINAQDENIVSLKTKELVLLLINAKPGLKNMLFEFSEPGKIDLEAFMNSHYRYNVSINRFAFLTGRSLAAFKRDFASLYHISPGKWLLQRRLQEAHVLLLEKKHRPSEIYLDLGFEDFSHFSFAYKRAYGYAPSQT